MVKKLRIKVKGFSREGYKKEDGTRVSGSFVDSHTKLIKDRGLPGRGPEILPEPKGGRLGGPGFFSKSKEEQHSILKKDAAKHGKKSTAGTMQLQYAYQHRQNPQVAQEAKGLRNWVMRSL